MAADPSRIGQREAAAPSENIGYRQRGMGPFWVWVPAADAPDQEVIASR